MDGEARHRRPDKGRQEAWRRGGRDRHRGARAGPQGAGVGECRPRLSPDGRIEYRRRSTAGCSGRTSAADRANGPAGKGKPAIMTLAMQPAEGPDPSSSAAYSPYHVFSSAQWARFRADTPLTLTADEVTRLRSLDVPIDIVVVRRIYLSLSRLLSAHVEASQLLFQQRNRFLSLADIAKTPFVIGIAGSVAVGKSTTARILKELLARWPSSPKVDLITTDGFLHPNAVLRRENLMERKGFPESYDIGALLRFLSAIKAGQSNVKAPRYSHLTYDVLPDEYTIVD